MQTQDKERIRQAVRERYGKVAKAGTIASGASATPCCCSESDISVGTNSVASCCGGPELTSEEMSAAVGYSKEDLHSVPECLRKPGFRRSRSHPRMKAGKSFRSGFLEQMPGITWFPPTSRL